MRSLEEAFAEELRGTLATERSVATLFQRTARCRIDPRLRRHLETHASETRDRVGRLQRILRRMREPSEGSVESGVSSVVAEHRRVVGREGLSSQAHTAYDLGVARRITYHEIAAFEHLLSLATTLGQVESAEMLRASLHEVRQHARRLQAIATEIERGWRFPRTREGGSRPRQVGPPGS